MLLSWNLTLRIMNPNKTASGVVIFISLGVLYLLGPLISGWHGIGASQGPKIYPASLHRALYILSYEKRFGSKPRLWVEEFEFVIPEPSRPWFYGGEEYERH